MTLTFDHQANPISSPFAGVRKRAVIVALVLGCILTGINQSEAVFGAQNIRYLPMALNFIIPFIVVVISQILGIRKALSDALTLDDFSESALQTAFSHGIPIRALLMGLFVGSLNAFIASILAFLTDGTLASLPLVALAQAYSLPVVFGIVSQTISYRRTMAAST
jgi:hypothetical protein